MNLYVYRVISNNVNQGGIVSFNTTYRVDGGMRHTSYKTLKELHSAHPGAVIDGDLEQLTYFWVERNGKKYAVPDPQYPLNGIGRCWAEIGCHYDNLPANIHWTFPKRSKRS